EIVGVGSGAADHGQDFTAARIESDHGPGTLPEGLFSDLLQIHVNAELDLLAWDGILLCEVIDFLADGIDDDAAHAVAAHQDVVVLALQAEFANNVARTQFTVAVFD